MSVNCCCKDGEQNGCDKDSISACCLPSGSCIQTNECDCLKKGGKWLPLDAGVSAPCSSCYVCKCCQKFDETGQYLYVGTAPAKKTAIYASGEPCPNGTERVTNYAYDSTNECNNVDCNVACNAQEKGTCCYDCGCQENITRCECYKLIRLSNSTGTSFGTAFLTGGSCDTVCEHCGCVSGVLRTYASGKCRDLANGGIVTYGTDGDPRAPRGSGTSCEEIANVDPVGFVTFAQSCANSTGPTTGGGGGGPGGPPITPPIPPSPPQPPAPPKPCTRPANYAPMCAYKVWFTVTRNKYRYEHPGGIYTREQTIVTTPNFGTDNCNTLSCCGAPVPNCNGVETRVVQGYKKVNDCDLGTIVNEDPIYKTLTCNSPQDINRFDYQCAYTGEKDSDVREMEIVCVTAQFLRGCCDTNMNFLSVRIPDAGTRENGVWGPDYVAAYTMVLDLKGKTCVGYDRTHPSCK